MGMVIHTQETDKIKKKSLKRRKGKVQQRVSAAIKTDIKIGTEWKK